MDDPALFRLLTWLSPGYPVGAFAHSHGLEWAVEVAEVGDADGLSAWLADVLAHGAGGNDAILFHEAWQAAAEGDADRLASVAELALALCAGRERRQETVAQGNAFMRATEDVWPSDAAPEVRRALGDDVAYPVAVAFAAANHGVPVRPALSGFLHAFAANIISAGVRLIPLGQTDGQRVLAAMEPVIEGSVARGLAGGLDDLGAAALLSEIAALRHETQYTRLFRT